MYMIDSGNNALVKVKVKKGKKVYISRFMVEQPPNKEENVSLG